MPSADQHRRKAGRNRDFLGTIDIAAYPDWAATVAFYAAVHTVERLRKATGDGESDGHRDRLAYVRHRHPDIHYALTRLYDAAFLARYESVGVFFGKYPAEVVRDDLVGRLLPEVEGYVGRVLAGAAS